MVARVLGAGAVDQKGEGHPQAFPGGEGPLAHRGAQEGVGPKGQGRDKEEEEAEQHAPHGA